MSCSGGPRGRFRGLETPIFSDDQAFEWGHMVETPLYPGLGTPLLKIAGSAPVLKESLNTGDLHHTLNLFRW